jgi:hypothetical protein
MLTLYERSMLMAASMVIKLLVMIVRRQPGARVMEDEDNALLSARRLEDIARKG